MAAKVQSYMYGFSLNWDREKRTHGKATERSERARGQEIARGELNRPKPKMSGRARSILICRKGSSRTQMF